MRPSRFIILLYPPIRLLAIVGGLLLGAASVSADEFAVVGASVLPMTAEGHTLPDATVIVRDGRIAAVGARSEVALPAGLKIIDGRGAWLIPGLVDSHIHLGERSLGLLVANGVTTARELSGSDDHLRWREETKAGTRTGPRLIVFSPLLADGPQPASFRIVHDVAEAHRLVQEFARAGYDGIKIYDGLSAEIYAALIAEARVQGLRTTGHIPRAVGLTGVLAAGQALEHAEKTVIAECGHALDATKLPAAIAAINRSGVWFTPTLAVHEVLGVQGTDAYSAVLARPEMAWVSPSTMTWWNSLRGSGPVDPGSFGSRFIALQRGLTLGLARGGTRLLAGTDAPNPGMVAGFSLHDEIEALARAGLSNYAALAAATTAPAEYLGETGRSGVIAAGARADFVLVRGDPLADLRNLREPLGVALAGRWLDRAALDNLLAAARPKPAAK